MDYKDYMLLDYLSEFTEPIKPSRGTVPIKIGITFNFQGVDLQKDPDSFIGRLTRLKNKDLVKEPGANCWQITNTGREALKHYKDNMPKLSFEEQCDRVLELIVRQDKQPTNNVLNALEIAQKLEIDYDLVEAIGAEFTQRDFVQMLVDNGHDAFMVKAQARNYYHSGKTFVKEKQEKERQQIPFQDNSLNVSGNFTGVLTHQSSVSDSEIKFQQPTPKRAATNKATKMLIAILIAIIGGTIAGYLTWLITK